MNRDAFLRTYLQITVMPVILTLPMLKKELILWFLSFPLFLLPAQNASQSQETQINPLPFLQKEDPKALFEYGADDDHVEFYAEGSWEAEAAEHAVFSFTPQTAPQITLPLPVFSQKVDLSVWFLLNSAWYFEAAFADGFEKNTVAAGYYGDGILKHARISNRGISLSQNHALTDIGSGDNQAPGISVQLGGQTWNADMFIRYESFITSSKVFKGGKEIEKTRIAGSEWLHSVFCFPSTQTASALLDVFVEDENGSYVHESGKKLSKLNRNEYVVIPSESLLILTEETDGLVLASIASDTSAQQTEQRIRAELGSYVTDGFLYSVQTEFTGSDNSFTDLSAFSYGGSGEDGYFSAVSGIEQTVLLLQNPPFFSPFMCARFYEIPLSAIDSVSVYMDPQTSVSQLYEAAVSSDSPLYEQLTSSQNKLIAVYRTGTQKTRNFPFAPENSSLYLCSGNSSQPSYTITAEGGTPVSAYEIGTNALEGTIKVTVNGIEENGFTFDEKKGIVTINDEPKDTEVIRISWKEENKNLENGSASFAGGLTVSPVPGLNIKGGLSVVYPVSTLTGFSTPENPGEASLKAAAGAGWQKNGLSLDDTFQVHAVQSNPSGIMRIDGMDSVSSTSYLGKESVQSLSSAVLPVLNPRSDEILPDLTEDNRIQNASLAAVTDPGITSYAFLSSWSIDPSTVQNSVWTAAEIDISSRAMELQRADFFSLAFKEISYTSDSDYDIYLQLGNAEEIADKDIYERRIGTWKLSKKQGELNPQDVVRSIKVCSSETEWQTAQVALNDRDRSLIQNKPYARLIFIQHFSPSKAEPVQASVLIGPYETVLPQFSSSGSGAYSFSSVSSTSIEADIVNKFNPKGKNTVQILAWNSTGIQQDSKTVSFKKRISEVPLYAYSRIGFFLYVSENSSFSSIRISLNKEDEIISTPVYTITLPSELLSQSHDSWLSFEIDRSTSTVVMNGTTIDVPLSIADADAITPDSLEITVETTETGSGRIFLDELYASGTQLKYDLQNTFTASYQFEEAVVSIHEFPLIGGIHAELESVQMYSISTKSFSSPLSAKAGFSLAFLDLKGAATSSFRGSDSSGNPVIDGSITKISHSIKTKPLCLPFSYLELSEDFTFFPSDSLSSKAESLKLDLSKLTLPFTLKGKTKADYNRREAEQKAVVETALTFPGKKAALSFSIKGSLEQKKSSALQDSAYKEYYIESSKLQFSDGTDAFKRSEKIFSLITADIKAWSIKPSFTLEGSNEYSNLKEIFNASGFSMKTDIPFFLQRHQFSLSHKKELLHKQKSSAGGTYVSDADYYAKLMQSSPWFFKEEVFYDLYSPSLFETMNAVNTNNQTITYISAYSAGWKRPLMLTPLDILIPSAVEAGISRIVLSTGSFQGNDSIKINGGISFTSFNCFGSFSAKPVFLWYEQDELIHSWKTDLIFDQNTALLTGYTASGFEQFTIFISQENKLTQACDVAFNGKKELSVKTGLAWNRGGTKSLVTNALLLIPAVNKDSLKLARDTSVSYEFKKTADILHTVKAEHTLDSSLNSYVTVKTKAGLTLGIKNKTIEHIDISASAGVVLKF